jgi:hypothetical protein
MRVSRRQPGLERLADDLRSSHDLDLLAPGCFHGSLDGVPTPDTNLTTGSSRSRRLDRRPDRAGVTRGQRRYAADAISVSA